MDTTTKTSAEAATDSGDPFELEHLVWSSDGEVARTDRLDVAKQAQARLFELGWTCVGAQAFDDGVYQFRYAKLSFGTFVWGTQPYMEEPVNLYLFVHPSDELPYVLVSKSDGTIDFKGTPEEVNDKHVELGKKEYELRPFLEIDED